MRKRAAAPLTRMESLLAATLATGSWVASSVIAAGLLWTALAHRFAVLHGGASVGMRIVTVGIGLFIALPVLRVMLMALVFTHERDYRFTAIALAVLVIIVAGFVIGAYGYPGFAG